MGSAPPPLLQHPDVVTELQQWNWLDASAEDFGETIVTAVLRETLIALRQHGQQAAQQMLVQGLLGSPADRGVPSGHNARRLVAQHDVFVPQLSGQDTPDLVLTVPAPPGAARPYQATVVVEHKPDGTPAQFSRAKVLWPDGAQTRASGWGPGTLFDPDPVAQQYRDPDFVRDWVFGVPPGERVDERCLSPHPLASATAERCMFDVLARPIGEDGKPRWLHDHRYGPDALYLSIPQLDVYRCSRGWVDKHAGALPGAAFSLDTPAEVAWVTLSGKQPGTTVDALYKGWAATASEWAVAEYAWLRDHSDRAYAQVWNAYGQPAPTALPKALQWLRMLTSMLHLAKH